MDIKNKMSEMIEKRVVLESKFLDSNYKSHLLSKLKSNITLECTEEYGHIIDIIKIIDIISHKIDRTNSDNIFNVRFEAETIKPIPGKIMEGTVCMIYKDGIFISIMDRQKMLIPSTLLKGYRFDDTIPSYSDGMNTIMMDNIVKAKVTAVKYNKQNFSCFGSLV